MGPLVVTAAMAWADQLDAYVERQGHLQPLGDALLMAGADEGSPLVVLALPPDTPDDVVQRLAEVVRHVAVGGAIGPQVVFHTDAELATGGHCAPPG